VSKPDRANVGARERTIYRKRFSVAENEARDRIWHVLVDEVFQPMIAPGDTVLDLGCGFGEFVRHVRCARRIGVDVNTLAADQLTARGVEFHQGFINRLEFLPDASVDLVFSSNVLEHMPDKQVIDAVLLEAHRVLKPGGHIVLMGPNVRLLPGAYWDYWDHYVAISDRSLAEALRIAQFSVVDQIAAFMPYTTKSALPKAAWMVRLYLRNRWIWPVVGKQFLLRARR
jgi:dolichol-phosphate mannosyltransferase